MGKDILGFIDQVSRQIEHLKGQKSHKFSPLNDPEQIFPTALLVSSLKEIPQSLKDSLKEVARTHLQGTLKRQILFRAALRELGEAVSPPVSIENTSDAGDIVALVWYWERYGETGERAQWWDTFASVKDGLSLDQGEGREGVRVLLLPEIALLYEAFTRETANPDPNLLFELYPLHPRVKEIARKHFKECNYLHAVLEAVKAFEEYLKELTRIDKTCRPLVQESLGGKSPRIRFNSLQSKSEEDEQEGLKLIAEGLCAAFRNPKAHEPMDAPQAQISAFDALDQLVIISYIFKRVERSQEKSQL